MMNKSDGQNSTSGRSSVSLTPSVISDLTADDRYSIEIEEPLGCIVQDSFKSYTNFIKANDFLEDHTVRNEAWETTDSSLYIQPAFFSEIGKEKLRECGERLIYLCRQGLKFNQKPIEVSDGITGAFFMKKFGGGYAAIFKPEESLSRRCSLSKLTTVEDFGVKSAESSVREVAAFLLDHQSYAQVPETLMVKVDARVFDTDDITSSVEGNRVSKRTLSLPSEPKFCLSQSQPATPRAAPMKYRNSWKIGSLQTFIDHDCDAVDISYSMFSVEDVHKIGMFDIRTLNADRHEGNILIQYKEKGNIKAGLNLIPIDHGMILPEFPQINVQGNFCWMLWPQSKKEFNTEVKEYITKLNYVEDTQLLIKLLGSKLTPCGLLSLKVGTVLLKTCVLENNLTLFQIGELITGGLLMSMKQEIKSPLLEIIKQTEDNLSNETSPMNFKHEEYLSYFEKNLKDYLAKDTFELK